MARRIAIVGLGLIGGSMGLALKRAGQEGPELVGYARRPETAERARRLGAIDRAESSLAAAVDGADLVMLAVPIMSIKEILSQIAPNLAAGAVVTDVASTKLQVMHWAEEALPQSTSFVGGHPMAGKELSGIEVAEAGLFQGCTYCIVPGRGASDERHPGDRGPGPEGGGPSPLFDRRGARLLRRGHEPPAPGSGLSAGDGHGQEPPLVEDGRSRGDRLRQRHPSGLPAPAHEPRYLPHQRQRISWPG